MSTLSSPRFFFYLEEMHAAMQRIISYTSACDDFHSFENDTMRLEAIIRNFEIMGEAVKHVPFRFQRRHPSLPWREMSELRNFIVHEFFDIDNEILWAIIQTDLKRNANELAVVMAELGRS
jgi:uncharacterized protein with HEPN domain